MNIEELKINVLKNDFDSIKELATRMWTGDGIIKNQDATFELWKKAYELNPNDNLVARRMGSCYRFGHGVQTDNNIAKKYYLEAATREDSASQYFLGKILEENNDVECIVWYEKALLNGDIDSAVVLASIYLEGKLINKNVEKTDYYLSIVNDSKNPDAFLDVMRLYYFGTSDGKNKDIIKAITWCKKAVECGSKIAVGNLATLFKEADLNMDEYYRYIIETAVQYNDEALLCAYKYYRELGGEDNERIAYGYLSKALDNDYVDSYYEMGIIYFNGLSVIKIGESAFTNCTSLYYLKIPKNANVNPKAIPEHCKISYYLNNQDEIHDASYDLKQNTVISTGKTIDEAIENGKRLLNIGANEKVSYYYLNLFVEKVKFDSDDVFVDVGSAWGRMIGYLKQHTSISKFIGVELNKEIASLSKKIFLNDDNVKIISGDIVDNIPKNATVFYLFNPFNEVIMKKFLDAIEHNIEHPVRILYLYPTCKSVFDHRSNKWTITNRYILKPKYMGELELIEYRYIP